MKTYFKIKEDGDGDIVSVAETAGLYPDEECPNGNPGVAGRNETVLGNRLTHQGTPLVFFRSEQADANWTKYNAVREAFNHLQQGGGGWPTSLMRAVEDALFWVHGNYGRTDVYAQPLMCHKTLMHYNEQPPIDTDETGADCTCEACEAAGTETVTDHSAHAHRLLLSNGGTLNEDLVFFHPVTWIYYWVATTIMRPELKASIAVTATSWDCSMPYGSMNLSPNGSVGRFLEPEKVDTSTGLYKWIQPEWASVPTPTPVGDISNTTEYSKLILIRDSFVIGSLTESAFDFGYGTVNGFLLPYAHAWNVGSNESELITNFLAAKGASVDTSKYIVGPASYTKDPNAWSTEAILFDLMYDAEEWNGSERRNTPLANLYESRAQTDLTQLWAGRYARGGEVVGLVSWHNFILGNYYGGADLTGETLAYPMGAWNAYANASEVAQMPFFIPAPAWGWTFAIGSFKGSGKKMWMAVHDAEDSGRNGVVKATFGNMLVSIGSPNLSSPRLRLEITGDWNLFTTEEKKGFRDTLAVYLADTIDKIAIQGAEGQYIDLPLTGSSKGLNIYSAEVYLYDLFGETETSGEFGLFYYDPYLGGYSSFSRVERMFVEEFFQAESVENIDAEATRYPLLPH